MSSDIFRDPIVIFLPLQPKACPRPRATMRGGRVRTYMPPNYVDWQKDAVLLLSTHKTANMPVQCAAIDVRFYHKRPKRIKAQNPVPKTTKPDIDNLFKAVADALVSAQIIDDDNYIYDVRLRDWYCGEGQDPHIQIYIFPAK